MRVAQRRHALSNARAQLRCLVFLLEALLQRGNKVVKVSPVLCNTALEDVVRVGGDEVVRLCPELAGCGVGVVAREVRDHEEGAGEAQEGFEDWEEGGEGGEGDAQVGEGGCEAVLADVEGL